MNSFSVDIPKWYLFNDNFGNWVALGDGGMDKLTDLAHSIGLDSLLLVMWTLYYSFHKFNHIVNLNKCSINRLTNSSPASNISSSSSSISSKTASSSFSKANSFLSINVILYHSKFQQIFLYLSFAKLKLIALFVVCIILVTKIDPLYSSIYYVLFRIGNS